MSEDHHTRGPRTRHSVTKRKFFDCMRITLRSACAERVSPKYEKAALRWLERYLNEREPTLAQFALLASGLAKRVDDYG
jgi:hypothetical protein